jgi:hypothetical protein
MLGELKIPLLQKKTLTLGWPDKSVFMFGRDLSLGKRVKYGREAYFTILGGPYIEKPQGLTGVKMAREIPLHKNGDHEINIPTVDFQVPPVGELSIGLAEAVNQILDGKLLYVGCMAGRGRTGLFLAVLCRAFGIDHPVEYVRAHYYKHAVETLDQYKYVEKFPIPEAVTAQIAGARKSRRFGIGTDLTDQSLFIPQG